MISRRKVLQGLGFSIALPLLGSSLSTKTAKAQAVPKKKYFIGGFFGSGAPMPNGANGDWGYSGARGGALKPLADLGVAPNVSVLRGFRAVDNVDVHWSGTASFLSSTPVGRTSAPNPTSDPAYQRCAKTFDQFVADTAPQSRIRSLHVGYNVVPSWDLAHDNQYSINYVNCIGWRNETTPISNTNDPTQLFTQVFGSGDATTNERLQYVLKQKRSILDGVLAQYKAERSSLSPSDRVKLDAYAESIREVELELTNAAQSTTCSRPPADSSPESYIRNIRTMQKIVVAALACDLTRAATIMYNDGIGPKQVTSTPAAEQHNSAHNDWASLIQINQIQVGLWGDLIVELKNAGLLSQTVALLGSNMSDGRTHLSANIPLLLASENVSGELKLGQEVYGVPQASVADRSRNRNLADLYVDLYKLYGIPRTSFGGGAFASTGTPSGVLA